MSKHSDANYDTFGMYRLAYSVANNNWSLQDNALSIESWVEPYYYSSNLDLLKSIDFNDVDIITIAYGTNDFSASCKLDNPSDLYDLTSYAGALRYSVKTISEAYPHIKIVICSQIYRFWMDSNGEFLYDSDSRIINNVKLIDFVEKTEAVSNEFSLLFIDNYYGSGINKDNRMLYFPSDDGTHPNVNGRKKVAYNMAEKLLKQFG